MEPQMLLILNIYLSLCGIAIYYFYRKIKRSLRNEELKTANILNSFLYKTRVLEKSVNTLQSSLVRLKVVEERIYRNRRKIRLFRELRKTP